MMHEKLLTIIVPTYNRRESLRKGLEALIPQVERHKDQVSLYISDNCSDDGTAEVVGGFQARYPDLIGYKRQSSNLGAQGNFRDAVLSVSSKYVVLMSDDDCVLPWYVEVVLSQLNKYPNVGLINYNALSVSSSGQYIGVRDPLVTCGDPKYYAIGGEFIKEHTRIPSLVSSNVFNRQSFVDCISSVNPEDYPGYTWYAILLKGILDKPCVYIDQPLFLQYVPVHQRWEQNAAWYTSYGLSHLFSDLDKIHGGILDAWKSEYIRSGYDRYCLEIIGKYQKDYRTRYDVLMRYSASDYFSKNLKCFVFNSERYRYLVLSLWPRIVNKLKRLLHV